MWIYTLAHVIHRNVSWPGRGRQQPACGKVGKQTFSFNFNWGYFYGDTGMY
jgi:hypothetical protein